MVAIVRVRELLELGIQFSVVPIQSGSVPVQGCIKLTPVHTEQTLDAQLMFNKAVVEAGLVLVEPVHQRCVLNVARIRQDPESVR